MRRNHENTNEVVRENHSELKAIRTEVVEIRSELAEVVHQVKKATYQSVMQGPDISEFFPVKKEQQLVDFMDRQHPEWEGRKREFYNFLFNCVTDDKKSFTKGLLKTLFSRDYMLTVKWPSFW